MRKEERKVEFVPCCLATGFVIGYLSEGILASMWVNFGGRKRFEEIFGKNEIMSSMRLESS